MIKWGQFRLAKSVGAEQKGSAFRRTSRPDLDWVFTVQTERIVAKDNTVAMGERVWQIEKSRFRSTLAGCTVTIHEHLDGRVSLRSTKGGSRRLNQTPNSGQLDKHTTEVSFVV